MTVMAKTKEQVKKHLRNLSFSGNDWMMVLGKCRDLFGGGSIHRAIHPTSESTYKQFTDWLDNGYGSGDVVRCGDRVCIVADETPDHVEICVAVNDDGEIDTDAAPVPRSGIVSATDNERKRLSDIMRRNGYSYSESLGRLVRAYKPLPYERVSAVIRGKRLNGIFREFTDDGLVRLVFHVYDGKIIEGYCGDADVSRITKDGIQEIDNALASHDLMWNYRTQKIEKTMRRAKEGETYWYISDKFTVVSGKDNRNATHNTRYKRGNYFVNYKDALDFLIEMDKIRKNKGR